MPRFVRSQGGGLINADDISTLELSTSATEFVAHNREGERLGKIDPDTAFGLSCTFLPATTPMTAVIIVGDETPFVMRLPIIGWSVDHSNDDTARPLLFENFKHSPDSLVLIETPDGKLCDPDSITFDDLEGALAYYKKYFAKEKVAQ